MPAGQQPGVRCTWGGNTNEGGTPCKHAATAGWRRTQSCPSPRCHACSSSPGGAAARAVGQVLVVAIHRAEGEGGICRGPAAGWPICGCFKPGTISKCSAAAAGGLLRKTAAPATCIAASGACKAPTCVAANRGDGAAWAHQVVGGTQGWGAAHHFQHSISPPPPGGLPAGARSRAGGQGSHRAVTQRRSSTWPAAKVACEQQCSPHLTTWAASFSSRFTATAPKRSASASRSGTESTA